MKVYCGTKVIPVLWSSFGVSLQGLLQTPECIFILKASLRHPPEVWKLSQQKLGPIFFTSETVSVNHYHLSKVYMDAIWYRPPTWKAQTHLVVIWLVWWEFSNYLRPVYSGTPVESSGSSAADWRLRNAIFTRCSESQKLPYLTVSYRCMACACEYAVVGGIARPQTALCLTNPHTLLCCFHSLTLVLLGGETWPRNVQGMQERERGEVCYKLR